MKVNNAILKYFGTYFFENRGWECCSKYMITLYLDKISTQRVIIYTTRHLDTSGYIWIYVDCWIYAYHTSENVPFLLYKHVIVESPPV